MLASDLDGNEQLLQDITRAVFGPAVQQTIRTIAATLPSDPPHCLQCERQMRPGDYARPRTLQGLAGDYRIVRPYFLCDRCHHGCASLDEHLGIAAGMVSPDLARVVCRLGIADSSGDAVNALDKTLRISLTGEAARWVIEGIGQVAETEPEAAIALAQAGKEPLPNYAEIYRN